MRENKERDIGIEVLRMRHFVCCEQILCAVRGRPFNFDVELLSRCRGAKRSIGMRSRNIHDAPPMFFIEGLCVLQRVLFDRSTETGIKNISLSRTSFSRVFCDGTRSILAISGVLPAHPPNKIHKRIPLIRSDAKYRSACRASDTQFLQKRHICPLVPQGQNRGDIVAHCTRSTCSFAFC